MTVEQDRVGKLKVNMDFTNDQLGVMFLSALFSLNEKRFMGLNSLNKACAESIEIMYNQLNSIGHASVPDKDTSMRSLLDQVLEYCKSRRLVLQTTKDFDLELEIE